MSSLTNYFCVPKGNDDIRMVYDATQYGLNAAVTPPNFFMPTINASLRSMEISTWCGDIDLGEMEKHLLLEHRIVPQTPYSSLDSSMDVWLEWERK